MDHTGLSSTQDLEPLYQQNQLYIIHAVKQKNSMILMINSAIKDGATSTKAIFIMIADFIIKIRSWFSQSFEKEFLIREGSSFRIHIPNIHTAAYCGIRNRTKISIFIKRKFNHCSSIKVSLLQFLGGVFSEKIGCGLYKKEETFAVGFVHCSWALPTRGGP